MRKICLVTGTRAEYGLLYWLMKEIQNDPNLELQIIVTGMHLSPEFGLTYRKIEQDGFIINKKIEMLLSSDSEIAIAKSVGLGTISFTDALCDLKPNVVVLLGDRYEILAAAQTAMLLKIPIAHIHGGEATEGLIDEAIRHSITKMSHLHFVATEQYKNRVIQLGEKPEMVFNFGAPGLDHITRTELLSKHEFEQSIKMKLEDKTFLMTYHPVTLSKTKPEKPFKEILLALDHFKDYKIIFTKANSDANGRIINHMIDEYVSYNKNRSVSFTSLGQKRYLSALKYINLVLGNSSSGIIEAPSFKIPTINIGDRQKGRIKADSVINCSEKKEYIMQAITKALSQNFQITIKNIKNPYGNEDASYKIKEVLKNHDLHNILMKSFYDLESR